MVGPNSSGKSSVVEALRFLSIACNIFNEGNITFYKPSKNLNIIDGPRGFSVSLKGLEFDFETVFYHYNDPPGMIEATFQTNEIVTIFVLKQNRIFVRIKDTTGKPVTTWQRTDGIQLPEIGVLPQLAPLASKEIIMLPDDVFEARSLFQSSSEFRAQLYAQYDRYFDKFKQLVESTWPNIRINELKSDGNWMVGKYLWLFVQDRDFVAEASWMGHGLQLWLQVIWFIARTEDCDIVVLDEPDVYLHPDLQHKLIQILRCGKHQTIISTHSTETISEAEPDQILMIDRKKSKSAFTSTLPGVQSVIDNIGGVHNLQLTKLWSSRKCLFIEGKDVNLLKYFQMKIFPETEYLINLLPNISIGGWGGWNYAVGSSIFLKNAGGKEILIYCILDSDYHTKESIEGRVEDAKKRGIQLHIWKMKELENYLLSPDSIQRIIASRISNHNKSPTIKQIIRQINVIAGKLKNEVFDSISIELYTENKTKGIAYANKTARRIIENIWSSPQDKWGTVSGKRVLSLLSGWSQKKFGVSFSPSIIAQELRPTEIPSEVVEVIDVIENRKVFSNIN